MKETGGYNTPSGWNAVASNRIVGKRMQRDLKVRFLVIGAGFAGLAIARRLAARFPDEAIALVDALEPAENSSARNSGFMINLPFAKIRANSSSDQNQWQTRLMSMGQQLLEQTVARHGIDCDW
ncbi:MAG: FAD-dependent oxidoreductase, partial [Advenella sp.]